MRPALVPGPQDRPPMTDRRTPLQPGTAAAREALLAAAAAGSVPVLDLLAELGVALYAAFRGAARVVAAQGYLRAWDADGLVRPRPWEDAAGVLAEGAGFRIAEIAVWAAGVGGRPVAISPCGGCRQRIFEFAAGQDTPVHFNWPASQPRSMGIGELLPCAFERSAD